MAKRTYKPEEIVAKLRQVDVLHGQGMPMAEAKGLPLEPTGQAMRVALGAESATFTIKERTRREKHVPTPEELAAEERRQKKRPRYWQSPRARSITIHSSAHVYQL